MFVQGGKENSYYKEKALSVCRYLVCFECVSDDPVLLIPGNSNLFLCNFARHAVWNYSYPQFFEKLDTAGEKLFGLRFRGDCRVIPREQAFSVLAGELSSMQNFLERIRFLEKNINRLFYIEEVHPLLRKALKQIESAKGNVTMEELVDAHGYSVRQLERVFKAQFGYGPKRYCQYARILHVVSHIQENPDQAVFGLSEHTGYADGAHLQREFKKYVGMSPRQFQKEHLGNFFR